MVDPKAIETLEKLHKLKSEGIITDEEFQKAKEAALFGAKRQVRPFGIDPVPQPPEDQPFEWIILPLKRYAQFEGRSSRQEFWMFQLIPVGLIAFALLVLAVDTDQFGDSGPLSTLTVALTVVSLLALVVPLLAVEARRFHDMDRSGWYVLINLVPYIGSFIVYILMLTPGMAGTNQYGPDPHN